MKLAGYVAIPLALLSEWGMHGRNCQPVVTFFLAAIGIILLAMIGDAAEHSSAILMARRNDMDTAMAIAYQSSLQISLFVVPPVVFVSAMMSAISLGHAQMLDLLFSPMEVLGVLMAVGTVVLVGLNGRTNWFEGVLPLALYAILAIAFFHVPSGAVVR